MKDEELPEWAKPATGLQLKASTLPPIFKNGALLVWTKENRAFTYEVLRPEGEWALMIDPPGSGIAGLSYYHVPSMGGSWRPKVQ